MSMHMIKGGLVYFYSSHLENECKDMRMFKLFMFYATIYHSNKYVVWLKIMWMLSFQKYCTDNLRANTIKANVRLTANNTGGYAG